MSSILQPLTVPREALRPPSTDSHRTGALMSLLAHAGLVAALALGVQWHTDEPAGVEAELWAAVPQIAAPRAEPPEPEPESEPVVIPPTPSRPAPPPPVTPTPPRADEREADIATERAERLKREKEREEADDKRAREKRQQAERDKKAEADKDRQAKLKAEQDAKRKVEQDARQAQAAELKRTQAEAAQREKMRQDQIRRMQAQLGGTGAPDSTGTAARTAGPSASYAGRIKARIKPNIVLTDDIPGNPTAEVEVRVAIDGTITGRRIVKSSGSALWDDTVLRAIDRTAILPRDVDGRVQSTMVISFRPVE